MNGEKWMPLQLHNDVDQLEQERDWLAERLSSFCAGAILGLPLDSLVSREWVSAAIAGRSTKYWLDAARKSVAQTVRFAG